MKMVQVLEKDPKSQKEIIEALLSIQPAFHIRIFNSIESYAIWVQKFIKEGPRALLQGGVLAEGCQPMDLNDASIKPEVSLLVVDSEMLGIEHLPLIKKTRDLYFRKGASSEEGPPGLIVTAFENPDFEIKTWIIPEVNNLIFKPFDRLILSQHLIHAIDGRNPPSAYTISNQKADAKMEILKDIKIIEHTDIGFTTLSERVIPVGTTAKYYSEYWKTNVVRSAIAKVIGQKDSQAHKGMVEVEMELFGLDPSQITNIRKLLNKKPIKTKFDGKIKKLNILNLDPNIESMANWLSDIGGVTLRNITDFFFQLEPDKAVDEVLPRTVAGDKKSISVWLSLDGDILFDVIEEGTGVILNQKLEDLKKLTFSNLIISNQRIAFRKLLTTPKASQCFLFYVQGKEVLLKLTAGDKDADGKKIQVLLEIPSKDEAKAWFKSNNTLPENLHALLIPFKMLGSDYKARWELLNQKIKERFGKEVKLIIVAEKLLPEVEEIKLAELFDEIFYFPLDRAYFMAKLSHWFSHFSAKDGPDGVRSLAVDSVIKSANPVHISELSEAGVIVKYPRDIKVGTYREFVLWQPYEIGAPELLAASNFSEESGDPELPFACHFVFFGIRDHHLKSIRVWIRDNYISAKESGS